MCGEETMSCLWILRKIICLSIARTLWFTTGEDIMDCLRVVSRLFCFLEMKWSVCEW